MHFRDESSKKCLSFAALNNTSKCCITSHFSASRDALKWKNTDESNMSKRLHEHFLVEVKLRSDQ